jgi:hypothetical protein
MKSRSPVVTVGLALIASTALVTTAAPAVAGGLFGHSPTFATPALLGPPIVPHGVTGDNIVPHGVTGDTIVPHGLFRLPLDSRFAPAPPFRHHFHGGFVPSAVIAPPVIVVVPPDGGYYDQAGTYYGSPDDSGVIYTSPMGDTQPAAMIAPSAPPTPNVIQYPTGRYELRGDGLTTAYTWVWIPNPPPPPPAAPPMAAPSSPGPSWSSSPGRAYRWTDAEGVLHLTDRLEAVPPEYREQAKQNRPS